MLTLTDAAAAFLRKRLAAEKSGPGVTFRLVHDRKRGFTLTLDRLRLGDETFTSRRKLVLLLDASVAELLKDDTLELKPAPGGERLRLKERAEEVKEEAKEDEEEEREKEESEEEDEEEDDEKEDAERDEDTGEEDGEDAGSRDLGGEDD
jgi:hypothetical protein